MLDFGWQELLIISIVLVLVVGPKDMPKVARGISKTVGKARRMANEFRNAMMDAADQDEIREVRRALNDAQSAGMSAVDDNAVGNAIGGTVIDAKPAPTPKPKPAKKTKANAKGNTKTKTKAKTKTARKKSR